MGDNIEQSNSSANENKRNDETKKKLFNKAMKGQWKEVIDIYRENPWIHQVKITRSGATALHIAVFNGEGEIVKMLVDIIRECRTFDALKMKDELGNTPLHNAALLGKVNMCRCIATVKPSLIGIRNLDNETPFFVSVLHGHKNAFLSLHYLCEDNGGRYCRGNHGNTILHAAISGDYYGNLLLSFYRDNLTNMWCSERKHIFIVPDLAFQIIYLYSELVNSVNELGLSPLHLLAGKPSAFRSGSHLRRWDLFIYHCIFVDELKVESRPHDQPSSETEDVKETFFPPNNETFHHFITLIWKAMKIITKTAAEGMQDEGKPEPQDAENPSGQKNYMKPQGHQLFPPNYRDVFDFVKLVSKGVLVVLGVGSTNIKKLRHKKRKHTWSLQIMNELLEETKLYEYEDDGRKPQPPPSLTGATSFEETKPYAVTPRGEIMYGDAFDMFPPFTPSNSDDQITQSKNQEDKKEEVAEIRKKESPLLIAAKNGIIEIVEKILDMFPVAIHDMNYQKKNVVLLAVENRQPFVYKLLLEKTTMKESVFKKVDDQGNSALHLAAKLGEHKPWLIPGAAMQMQWEIKWYEFVKESMSFNFFARYNKANKFPRQIFTESHKDLVEAGGQWLTNTSESCSVVAALIATVAFATSTTVPGGVKEESGTPTLENQPAFDVFAIASLVALCFSVTSVIMFLAILTSRYQERDFHKDLPRKLLLGLTSLFVSIAAMLISFCAGHFFVLKDKLKYAALPVYAVTCLPVTFFAIAQFPLYFDLVWATFKKVPQRSYKPVPN